MSEPSKKKRASKQKKKEPEPKRTVKEKTPKPVGAPPSAMVDVGHGGRVVQRQASGYSLGEVAKANLNVGLVRRWGVHVDDRRRSVLDGNVASLKKWAPHAKKPAEERVEGEVKKIEKAVEKEVRKVEKEAKKVEAEAKKVEAEVVKKVEAPMKKRPKKKAAAEKKTSE